MFALAVTEGSQPVSSPPTAPLQERCHVCGSTLPSGAAFCPNCGAVKASLIGKPMPYASPRMWMEQQYYSRPKISFRVTGKSIVAGLMLTMLIMTGIMLFTLVYGVSIVGPAIIDGTGNLSHYGIFVVLPFFVTILTLSGPSLFAFYMFLIFAIMASAGWVIATSMKTYVEEIIGKAKSMEHSPLFDVFGLFCASLFFTYAVVLVVILVNGNTGTSISTGSLADSLFLLANAAVWEEVAVRVLLLGVPLLIIGIIFKRLQRKPLGYILGGGFKIGTIEAVVVIVSATVFGVAHWVGGWPPWKIPVATVAGFAFGYLFLKHGLPAAILMHFVNDYITMPISVFSSAQEPFGIAVTLLVLGWALLGSVLFAYYFVRSVEFLTNRTFFGVKPAPIGMPGFDPRLHGSYPQPYSHVPVPNQQIHAQTGVVTEGPQVGHGFTGGYVCPACGYTQSRWADGRFQCLRCGNIS